MAVVYLIDLWGAQGYEVAALTLATLARPGWNELDERMALNVSLCSWLIRDRAKRDAYWAAAHQSIKPIYLARSEADMKRDMRTLERRLRHRLTAGHMAIAFLKEAESGEAPRLPAGAEGLSVDQLCKTVTSDLGIECPNNVESRVWRPSLPVLHLCAALVATLAEWERSSGAMPTVNEFADDPEFLPTVLARAAYYEGLLQKSRLRIHPERLIQLRPAPGSRFKKIA